MNTKLYCQHCQKHYDVSIDDIRFMLMHDSDHLKQDDKDHYHYINGCFFNTLRTLKSAS